MLRPVADAVSDVANAVWLVRDKDCTVALADALGMRYTVLSRAARGVVGNAVEMAANTWRSWRFTRRQGVDLWVTKYGAANLGGRLAGRPSISFNDDDADVVPLVAWTSYPFARCVMATSVTRMGRFERRAIRYPGYHELFYLHPRRFEADGGIRAELGLDADAPYALVRLSSLQAHHDVGESGVGRDLVRNVMQLAEAQEPPVRVFISSEAPIDSEFEPYRFPIAPVRMHHALALAEFIVGDSQTMTAEAAVLGTPAFRLSSFVGRISYIEDLQRYGLTFGFRPGEEQALLAQLRATLEMENRRDVFAERRRRMLAEKVDPVPVAAELIRAALAGTPLPEAAKRAAVAQEGTS
jgi:predicted glycosyltransferase